MFAINVLPPRYTISCNAQMGSEPFNHVQTNKLLAHEVIAYAERCACDDSLGEPLPQFHARWASQYFADHPGVSPAIASLPSECIQISPNTVFLSLADREEVVALRILLTSSNLTLTQLRAGLKEEHFPQFTSAVRAFVRSPIQIHRTTVGSWPASAVQILRIRKPKFMIVEGLQFAQSFSGNLILAQSAELIRLAAANQTGLLLFD